MVNDVGKTLLNDSIDRLKGQRVPVVNGVGSNCTKQILNSHLLHGTNLAPNQIVGHLYGLCHANLGTIYTISTMMVARNGYVIKIIG